MNVAINIGILVLLVLEITGFYKVSAIIKGNVLKRFVLLLLLSIGITMASIFYFVYFDDKYIYLFYLTIGITPIILSIKWIRDRKKVESKK